MSHAIADRSSGGLSNPTPWLRIPDLSQLDEDVTVALREQAPPPPAASSQATTQQPDKKSESTSKPAPPPQASSQPAPMAPTEPVPAPRARPGWWAILNCETPQQMLTLAGIGLLIGLTFAVAAQMRQSGPRDTKRPVTRKAASDEKTTKLAEEPLDDEGAESSSSVADHKDDRARSHASPAESSADDETGEASSTQPRVARRPAPQPDASVEFTGNIEPVPR